MEIDDSPENQSFLSYYDKNQAACAPLELLTHDDVDDDIDSKS